MLSAVDGGEPHTQITVSRFQPVLERMFELDNWREWPSPGEVLAFEGMLAYKTAQESSKGGRFALREGLLKDHCLLIHEAEGIVALSRKLTSNIFSGTKKEERSLVISQLEDIIRRSKEIGDVRAELAAVKLVTRLLGLEPEKVSEKKFDDEHGLDNFEFIDVKVEPEGKKNGKD